MRRVLAVLILTLGLVIGLVGAAAAAPPDLVLNEQTTSFQYIDGGAPGRGVGDVLVYTTILIDPATGQVVGRKEGRCTTIRVAGDGDFIARCQETIYLPGGTVYTDGSNFNQTEFEAFVPQTLNIVGGTGQYANVRGIEVLQQTRFPDQAQITLDFHWN